MSLHIGEQDAAELDHDREQDEAAIMPPEHADEYIYEPLPGDRWIRVLILEPAQELDSPLIARLELLALGSALPMCPRQADRWSTDDEKQQHEAYVLLVQASRLPYIALSYSWAMDNGDDSLSRRMSLSGKQVHITQNLSEGLRRIRSKSESQRLWVDALCINQTNTAERSAQVAMMADIFKLAKRCILWLGEGPTKETDLAVWRLSHCISPNIKSKASVANSLWGYEDQGDASTVTASAVLNAFMAVVNNSCTIHTCNKTHLWLSNAGLDYPRVLKQLPHSSDGLDDLRDEPYPGMLTPELEAVARQLSMLSLWLSKRYWQRRWMLQENASRNHASGATDYYWGEFSLDRDGFQTMLQLLHSVAQYNDCVLLVARFTGCVNRALAVMEAEIVGQDMDDYWQPWHERIGSKDLCDHLRTYADLKCADQRDRLYSLVSLDPGYGVRPDYTLAMRDVSIEFSGLMVRKGEYLRLLGAGPWPRPRGLDLPSWVLDLRGPCPFPKPSRLDIPVNAAVIDRVQLSLELYFIGLVTGVETVGSTGRVCHLVFNPRGLRSKVSNGRASGRWKVYFANRYFSYKEGDALYSGTVDEWSRCILWLRPVERESSQYHVIDFISHLRSPFETMKLYSREDIARNDGSSDMWFCVAGGEYEPREDSRKMVYII